MIAVFPVTVEKIYKVAALVTSYNEDTEILKLTLLSVKSAILRYGFGKTFLLDDSTNREISDEMYNFCKNNGIEYIHRDNRTGFKAGAINNALKMISKNYDLFTVFDADQRPSSIFYDYVIIHFNNTRVSMVQVPQFYSESNTLIAKGAYYQQIPFLRIIMRGRNLNSAFSLGSGTTFRISHIKEVGFMKENTVTEDISTSVMLHARGYISEYVDFPGIWYGESPRTLNSYLKQQGRWSLGGFQLLPDLIRENLSFSSFIDYLSGTAYWIYNMFINILFPAAY